VDEGKNLALTASRHAHVVVIKAGKIMEENGQYRKASHRRVPTLDAQPVVSTILPR